jgi:hypothetical protein
LKQGRDDRVRLTAPAPDELRTHLDEKLTVSLRALRNGTRAYKGRRWNPGKPEPIADALWRASDGYLDMLDAVRRASADGPDRPDPLKAADALPQTAFFRTTHSFAAESPASSSDASTMTADHQPTAVSRVNDQIERKFRRP